MNEMATDAQRERPGQGPWSGIRLASGLAVVMAVLALLVGGFLRGAGHTEDDEAGCECPLSEAAASSIDWAGSGHTPMLNSTAVEGGFVIRLSYPSDTEPAASFTALAARLDDAYGSDLETSGVGAYRVGLLEDSAGQWRLVFQTDRFSGDNFPVTLHVVLSIRVPDEEAETALEELAVAVGRLPN